MRWLHVLPLIAAACLAACSQKSEAPKAQAEAADDPVPVGMLSDDVRPLACRLDLVINPDEETFHGVVEIDVETARDLSRIWLHGDRLNVESFYATLSDGSTVNAAYEQKDVTGVARLTFERALPKGALTLHGEYSASFATSPAGLYRAEEGGLYYAASQFESISARSLFPGFDEPLFKTPYDISVTAKSSDVVVTIAPEVSAETVDSGMVRHVFKTTKPVPSYLLAFAVGPYDVNEWTALPPNDVRARPLPLRGIAARGKGGRMDYALENTAGIVQLLEDYFDTPFPYDKLDLVAPPDFFGGAMENVGAIFYNEFLMMMDENSALSQRRSYETVHAHELAHQWFGDYVTPAWWDDIWLNESFASWMEYKIARAHWPEGQFDRNTLRDGLEAMSQDSLINARQIRNPVETNASIDDSFDGVTYEKGGAVLAMFESYLGEEAFREGIRTHMQRFPHGTATVDDFMKSMADGSGRPEVIPAFRSFISQPGVPLLAAQLDCDGAPVLKLHQSRYAPLGSKIDTDAAWKIPACVAYGTDSGGGQTCSLIDAPDFSLALPSGQCPAYVVPNGDGSGYFRFALDEAGWKALAEAGEKLTPEQALAYADSLDAAFRAGAASSDVLLDGFTALSRHAAWDVVSSVADKLELLTEIAPDDEALSNMQALAGKIMGPVYAALGDSDDAQSQLLRTSLARFMAVVAIDPETRSGMLGAARAYVGLDGDRDETAIDPDLVETVLSVGVQEDGAPFFDALLALVRGSDDPALRGDGIGALARTEDPALTVRLLDAVIAEEFSANEMNRAVFRQISRPKTRDVAWAWVKGHYPALYERNAGLFGGRTMVAYGGNFCSEEAEADYKAYVLGHKDDLPGYERSFAQITESIELCTALKTAKGAELAAAAAARL